MIAAKSFINRRQYTARPKQLCIWSDVIEVGHSLMVLIFSEHVKYLPRYRIPEESNIPS